MKGLLISNFNDFFFVCQGLSKEIIRDAAHHIVKIIVHDDEMQGGPPHVIIVIEGKEVLDDCKSVTKACILLMGFIYAMNTSYPIKLKYTYKYFRRSSWTSVH